LLLQRWQLITRGREQSAGAKASSKHNPVVRTPCTALPTARVAFGEGSRARIRLVSLQQAKLWRWQCAKLVLRRCRPPSQSRRPIRRCHRRGKNFGQARSATWAIFSSLPPPGRPTLLLTFVFSDGRVLVGASGSGGGLPERPEQQRHVFCA
jgi:hypothetical protein